MRLLTHVSDGTERLAVATRGDVVVDVEALLRDGPWTMARLLADVGSTLPAIEAAMARAPAGGRRRTELDVLAPVPRPGKIIAVGKNYHDHATEEGLAAPTEPLVFAKFASALIGDGAPIAWRDADTAQVDYEAELAVVIGRAARDVSRTDALGHVLGYTCLNDVSARDIQFSDGQWVRGKSLDTFCPLGPWLVTADEVPNPGALRIRCLVNGEVLQDASTSEMVHDVPALIAFCSRYMTLEPGDIIATGTPGGVGVFRQPPRFLGDGDEVVVEIEGVGRLTNRCHVLQG